MSYCNACGTEVPEGARFCQNCGAQLAPPSDPAPAEIRSAPAPPHLPPSMPAHGYTPPAYPPPPYPIIPGYPVAPPKSGKAIAGFWLGVASIPCAILSWIGIIIGLLGLIFGLLGLGEARRLAATTGEGPARYGRRQAGIGIACAIIGIIASTAVLVYLLNNLDKYGIKITR